jgi:hypothetical protein
MSETQKQDAVLLHLWTRGNWSRHTMCNIQLISCVTFLDYKVWQREWTTD